MTDEDRAIALYVKDGGRMCEWHAADPQVRHFYRLAALGARPAGKEADRPEIPQMIHE